MDYVTLQLNFDNCNGLCMDSPAPLQNHRLRRHAERSTKEALDCNRACLSRENSIAINRIDESCVPGRGAEVAAIVCGEGTKIFILH